MILNKTEILNRLADIPTKDELDEADRISLQIAAKYITTHMNENERYVYDKDENYWLYRKICI